jgi:hypothetical protein
VKRLFVDVIELRIATRRRESRSSSRRNVATSRADAATMVSLVSLPSDSSSTSLIILLAPPPPTNAFRLGQPSHPYARASTSCASCSAKAVDSTSRDVMPVGGVLAVDKFTEYSAPVFTPQQIMAWPTPFAFLLS